MLVGTRKSSEASRDGCETQRKESNIAKKYHALLDLGGAELVCRSGLSWLRMGLLKCDIISPQLQLFDDDLLLGFISGIMNWQKKSETQVIQAPAQIGKKLPIMKM